MVRRSRCSSAVRSRWWPAARDKASRCSPSRSPRRSATTQPLPASTARPRPLRRERSGRDPSRVRRSRRADPGRSSTSRPTASTCAMTSARSRRSWTSTNLSVLMLDSLRSLTPGLDENDSKDTEAALRPVVRFAAADGHRDADPSPRGQERRGVQGVHGDRLGGRRGFTMSRHDETRRTDAPPNWRAGSRPAPMPPERWIKLGVSAKAGSCSTRPSLSSPREKRRRATASRPSFASTSTGCHSGCQVPRRLRGLAPWHPRGRPPNLPDRGAWSEGWKGPVGARAAAVARRAAPRRGQALPPLGSFFERNGNGEHPAPPEARRRLPAPPGQPLMVVRRVRSRARSARPSLRPAWTAAVRRRGPRAVGRRANIAPGRVRGVRCPRPLEAARRHQRDSNSRGDPGPDQRSEPHGHAEP